MKKILVVDNHPVMRKFMSSLLGKKGYQVLTAEDGISALDILETFIPDVIFLDLIMPNINGEKLCPIIRDMPKFKDTYIVILSGIAAEEQVNVTEIGANACIAKGPFNEMTDHVLTVLNKIDRDEGNDLTKEVLGYNAVYKREVTKELLCEKRHSEIIYQNISEGILELNVDERILYANLMAISLCGVPEGALLASKFSMLFEGPHRRRISEIMNLIDKGDQKIPDSSPIILKGKQISLTILTVKDEEDKSIIVILKDVSEQRRLESQLQRAQKMEAIGTLAGGVAHDLNNILSGIISYPELLLLDLPEDSPLRKPLLTIQNSGEKAAVVVQDLLTLARRGVITEEIVNLNSIISIQLKSPEYENLKSFHSNVDIETSLEKNLLNIKGSTAHLGKTVFNLISNAAEAMPDGGKVFISTENLYIDRLIKGYDHVTEGDYVTVTVIDTGIGISEEDLKRIFEPFYTKKVMGRSGSGLGMSVVWGTVKDHNGYIDVESTEGRGTTFTLYFPVTREELTTDKSLLSIEDYMGKGESILLIDDVKEQREIASGMLKKLGYSVTAISNGEEAIEYMKDNSADLLVLDMIMDPGIDGLETYKKILKLHPKQKAVIASGFSETDRVKKAKKLGVGQYIKKPYVLEKIGLAVKEELEK